MDSKTLKLRYFIALLLCVTFLGLTTSAYAQKSISGKVVDESNEPLIGVTVAIQGTTVGTITDIDGNYAITVPSGQENGTVMFSFIGYGTVTMPVPASGKLNIQMQPEDTQLGEVVAIGYGTKRKGDLTGSISSVSEKDFNGGVVSSPEQLINGKVAGVQIVNGGGSPSGGSTIRVRGGASLNASNDPLIVLDGVPLETGGISGAGNFLALINPADIESMSILKDASSTAIYGSRASNGVIIITTKKGAKDKLKINFNSTNSVSFKTKTADMLSADQLKAVVADPATIAEKGDLSKYIGNANTDWVDEIFRPAFGTDNNLSVSGNIAKVLPVRVSVGYMAQDGILLNDNTKRYSGNINLNPSFFNDALKVNFSMKASMNENKFAPQGTIYSAQSFNPTQPVYSDNKNFLGYNEAYNVGDDGSLLPITSAATNPVGLLNYREDESTVKRLITNLDVDYTFPFLKDLRAHITGGLDFGNGEGTIYVPADAYDEYTSGGSDYKYGPQKSSNKLFTGYLNYTKRLDAVNFDITAGYDYQYWNTNCDEYKTYNAKGVENGTSAAYDQTHVLLSYYGRANVTLLDKYMFTATIRRDGTSRFSKDERWGTFPSVAFAWRLSEESFMEGLQDVMNNLKLRISYGVTGQQDGIGNYGYLPIYSQSTSLYQYLWNGTPIYTYLPAAYVENLKWETTKSWNFGIDYGFLKDKVNGSLEFYTRKTEDLIASVPAAAGSNFDNQITTNVGNVESKGVEFSINYNVLNTADWGLDMSLNATWEKYEITNLSLNSSSDEVVNTPVRYAEKDAIQYFTEGQTPYAFYLYHQLYDVNGRAIEGAYSDDKYFCHAPAPDWMFAYSLSLRYKKWTLSTALRANFGNYVYNATAAKLGALETIAWGDGQINAISTTYLDTKFKQRQYQSDYYLHNASFLKMDNISLGYNFGQLTKWMSLNATFMVQNVFTATKYEGVDPEIQTGIEDSFYPRPRTFSLALSFQF